MPDIGETLSDRERDVLALLAEGASNKQIADSLVISPNTVKVHLRNIYAKLGASSRTEATRIGLEQGLVVMPGLAPVADTAVPDPSPTQTAVLPDAPDTPPVTDATHFRVDGRLVLLGGLLLTVFLVVLLTQQPLRSPGQLPTPVPFTPEDLGNNWTAYRQLPQPVAGMATVGIGPQLFQIGGLVNGEVSDLVQVYDSPSHQWERREPKPTAVSQATAAVLLGEIYVAGGLTFDDQPTNGVEVFSPLNNAWGQVAALPTPLYDGLLISDNSTLYFVGGHDGQTAVATVYQYDLAANSWQALPDMPAARSAAAGGFLNNRLYVVGGENETGVLDSCVFFERTEQRWESCAPMQVARADVGAAALPNRMVVIGGAGESIQGEIYDPVQDSWELIPLSTAVYPDAEAWTQQGVGLLERQVYVVGGLVDETAVDQLYLYSPLTFRTFLPATSSGE